MELLLESRKDKLLPRTKLMIINSYIRILYLLGYSNDGILLYKKYKKEINELDESFKCEIYYNIGKCYINMVYIYIYIYIIKYRKNITKAYNYLIIVVMFIIN